MAEWGVLLNGVYLSGGDGTQWVDITGTPACSGHADLAPQGCLTVPPAGLGLPPLRTEDVSYPQRDGVRHFSDWYEPRIITLDNVIVDSGVCPLCPTAREKVPEILMAWARDCDDAELVIFTDCHGSEPPTGGTGAITGPYGVVGRPRVADLEWLPGRSKAARLTLRFDAVDHTMYILDPCGHPGSGTECVTLSPQVSVFCREYDRCYPMCYGSDISDPGSGPVMLDIPGNICVHPTITFTGQLTDPFVENLATGEKIGISGTLAAGASPIIVNTKEGTATQDGVSRTHLITGSPLFNIDHGTNTLRLSSFGSTDDGVAEVCWRPAVMSA